MKKLVSLACAAAAMVSASQASAATLLTSAGGYTGPMLDLGAYNAFYTFTAGPIVLPGGITYSSSSDGSVIGKGGYGLQQNGSSVNALIIGTNSPTATLTFTFATAVAAFGGGINYSLLFGTSVPDGDHPVIAAYDASNTLIGSYDLFTLAPISTPGATDAFAFRGIDGDGTLIKSFTLSGGYAIIQGGAVAAVPEPSTWAYMIVGFGVIGAGLRRRTSLVRTVVRFS